MNSKLAVFMLLCISLPAAYAAEATPTADDPVLEKRVIELSHKLRCLVCQNQTIADSNAELAIDLRNQVREKLREGASEKEVIDYMSERYGDFVLFKPKVKSITWLLWFGPLLLVLLGIVVMAFMLRQRRKMLEQVPELSAEEHARASSLLSESNKGDSK